MSINKFSQKIMLDNLTNRPRVVTTNNIEAYIAAEDAYSITEFKATVISILDNTPLERAEDRSWLAHLIKAISAAIVEKTFYSKPEMVIVKNRNNPADWVTYDTSIGQYHGN